MFVVQTFSVKMMVMYSRVFTSSPIFVYFIYREQRNRKIGFGKKYGMMNFGENIIIIWILDKSRSVAPAKLEIKLVSPYMFYICLYVLYVLYASQWNQP